MREDRDDEPQVRIERLVESWRRPTKNPPRWHHYVPQFYLRAFADGKDRVARISKEAGEVDLISVKRAAAEIDFNRIELPSGEVSYEIEHMLSWVENGAAPAIRRIRKGEFPPSDRDKDGLAGFLGLQFARGRNTRDGHQLVEEWMLRFLARERFGDPDRARQSLRESTGGEPTDEEVAVMVRTVTEPDAYEVVVPDTNSIKIMLSVSSQAMLYLFNITWSCLRFGHPLLVTSDTPVHTWSKPTETPNVMGTGLVTSDEVRFPVGPRAILVLTPEGPSLHADLGDEWAWQMNLNTIATAYRWIFAPPGHPNLDRIADLAREAPPSGIQIDAFGERTVLRREASPGQQMPRSADRQSTDAAGVRRGQDA